MLGKYQPIRKLGEGGYASVYLCKDEVGARYACKSLPKRKNSYDRVRKEIDIMKTLQQSPNVVRYIEDGENDMSYYIVQEWCRGGSLHDHLHLQSDEGHNEKDVSRVTRSVLQTLCHLHNLDVVHGDVKPGNVLINSVYDNDLDIRLCDFGNSLEVRDACVVEVTSLIGTPEFMAPENLKSTYHKTSDVWSLGVMVYEMLCGRLPFNDPLNVHNPSLPLLYKSILECKVCFREPLWMHVSDEAKDFVLRCLQKDYQQRPSALECLEHQWISQMNDK